MVICSSVMRTIAQKNLYKLAYHPPDALGSVRQQTITYSETSYHWLLLHWSDSALVCNIYLTTDTTPTYQDIATQCGFELVE